jgi:anti-anti-sigma regulatory factor
MGKVCFDLHSPGNIDCMTLLAPPPLPGQKYEQHPFHSELHERESICVVRVCGSLVESAASVFEQVVGQMKDAPGRSVIVDASLLGEIDSQGVQKMSDLQSRVVSSGGKLVVYAASGDVAKALASSAVLH